MNKSLIPFSEQGLAHSIQDMINQVYQQFWEEPSFLTHRNWRPTEIREDEENFYIEIELPRFKKEQVKVEVKNGGIIVSAKNERSNYVRTFADSRYDTEKLDGKLEDGVLFLTVPKTTTAKSKEIKIR